MSKSIFSSQFWEDQWRNDPNTSLKKMKRAGLGSYDSPEFEKWALNYDRQSFSQDGKARSERIIKWIEQQIPTFKHMTILDVGAASGVFSVPFAQRGALVTAVEPSPLLSQLLTKNATTYDVDVNVMTAAFENKTTDEIGHQDFVFASMCPAVTDWEAVQKALKFANKYVYVSLMAGPKENKLVDELIEQFDLQGVPTTADMYYLLQLLYVNNYTYQTLIERHTTTTDMPLTEVMTQLPTWFTDFDIEVSTEVLDDIEHYLQQKYGTTIPITTGGKFGKVLIHVKYLYQLTSKGYLAVSGPIENEDEQRKEAYLILKADNKQKLQTLLENDLYWYEGLVADYTVEQWKPMFGDLNNLTINRPF